MTPPFLYASYSVTPLLGEVWASVNVIDRRIAIVPANTVSITAFMVTVSFQAL